MTTAQSLLVQAAVSVLLSIATVLLTVWLALRRFYREKWWEAKMHAYTDVIQALHHIKRDLEISITAEIEGNRTDTEFHQSWGAKHRAAWDDLRKYVDVGDFLFSKESVQILQRLMEDTSSDSDNYFEHLDILQSAVEKCLPAIKTAARSDLKLPGLHKAHSKNA
jgi:hypothetical protein